MHLIEIAGLAKNFGEIEAVRGISFTVDRGEVLGFLGPNGAGKSTTMKMLAGFLTPSAGRAAICGHDVVTDGLEARRRLGYLPEGAPAYPDMTAGAFLNFIAHMRGLKGGDARAAVDRAVGRVELAAVLNQPIETLSKGFKRRVGLAQALLHDPEVLIMDEPTDGLDPNQKHHVRGLIESMAKDKAIIISTHILEEVEAVCTRAMVIAAGRVLVDGTPAELEARSPYHHAIYLHTEAPLSGPVRAEILALPGVRTIESSGRPNDPGVYVMPLPGAEIAEPVRHMLEKRGTEIAELRIERGRLDGVFRDITMQAA
jgi:ABC-2 type transport system ATP-binding protein